MTCLCNVQYNIFSKQHWHVRVCAEEMTSRRVDEFSCDVGHDDVQQQQNYFRLNCSLNIKLSQTLTVNVNWSSCLSIHPPAPICFFLPQDSSFSLGEELCLQTPAHQPQGSAPLVQDSSFLSMKSGPGEEPGDELDLSFLPDELNTQDKPSCHDDTGETSPFMPIFK